MDCSLPLLRTALFLLVLGPAVAQQRVEVREADTGIALPGVPIHLGRAEREESHLVDGWLRRLGRRPTTPRIVRSDPDGRLAIDAAADVPLQLGPGFQLVQERDEDGVRVLLVQRCEDRAVNVVDAAGKGVAGFAVFRQRTGEIAVTDEFGMARFTPAGWFPAAKAPKAVDEVFSPAHWIGSAEVWAQVAAGGRDNLWRMQLPPFVTLRLRFVRHGVPATVAVGSAWLTTPVEHALWGLPLRKEAPQEFQRRLEPVTCRGIEIGPVAWTGAVRGEVVLGRLRLPFAVETLPAKGKVIEFDLETDPSRPWLSGVVRSVDRPAPTRVRIGALTDVGLFEDEVDVAANGRLLTGFDADRLHGTRLLRVWVDALGAASGAAVTIERQMPLQDVELELGELVLAAHAPVLRGRVVDARGRLVPHAQVVVQGAAARGAPTSVSVSVDGDGRFALAGPLFRDANGDAVEVAAEATVAFVHPGRLAPQPPPFRSPAMVPMAPGGEVELVLPDAATGAFVCEVRGVPQAWRAQLQVCVFDEKDQLLLHDDRLRAASGADVWCRGSIEMPVGRRRVQLRASQQLLHEVELQIEPTRPGEPHVVQMLTLDYDGLVRDRAVRAVDEAGQVIPAARVHLRTAGHKSGVMPDASGVLRWLEPLQLRHAAYLIAPGMQVVALPATGGGDVTMVPAVPVTLRLQVTAGEPLEGTWTAMLEPCEDTGMASYGSLGADGAVQFAGPAPGRYHVALFVRFDQFARRVRVGTVDVADHAAVPDALAIDAVALAALQAMQAEPPPKGGR